MNPRESSLDFSVFALHKPSYKVVEKIKADSFKATLPLALGVLGLSLLIVSHLAKAGEPVALSRAPLEIRTRNLLIRDTSAARSWETPLPTQNLPGQIENARWRVGLQGLALSPLGWRIEGTEAHVLVDGWKLDSELLSKNFRLKLTCRNADLSLLPPQIDLPWPQDLRLHVGVAEGKLRLSPQWNVEAWADQSLRPYFAPSEIDRNVQLNASCTGGSTLLIERLIRARLKNLPEKDPQLFEDSVQKIASTVRQGIDGQLRTVLPDAPAGLDFDMTLALSREWDDTLVFRPEGSKDFLTPAARALIRPLPASIATIEAILSPAALNRLMLLGMSALASKNGGEFKEGQIFYRAKKDFAAQKLSPYISELADLKSDTLVAARFVLPAAEDNPRVKPWISAGGLSGGIDLAWVTRIELLNAATGELLATRLLALELTFSQAKGADDLASWKYDGGRWLENEAVPNPAPVELGISIDWLLNSDDFREFFKKQLSGALAWRGNSTSTQFRWVGQALGVNRRAAGGYYAEALVIDSHPSF